MGAPPPLYPPDPLAGLRPMGLSIRPALGTGLGLYMSWGSMCCEGWRRCEEEPSPTEGYGAGFSGVKSVL